jgi:hypothetical protein
MVVLTVMGFLLMPKGNASPKVHRTALVNSPIHRKTNRHWGNVGIGQLQPVEGHVL